MDDEGNSVWQRAFALVAAAVVMVLFTRRRKAQLGPRIEEFLRGRGPTGVDEIRQHLGLDSLNAGDVRLVLDALTQERRVLEVEPAPGDPPGKRYRLP